MANDFKYERAIGREMIRVLVENMVAPRLFYNGYEPEFRAEKKGKILDLRVPATLTQSTKSGAMTSQDVAERLVQLTIEDHKYIRVTLTAEQRTFDLNRISEQVLQPIALAHARGVDQYILGKYNQIPNYAGTAASPVDTLAKVATLNRVMDDNLIPPMGRFSIVDTIGKEKMFSINEFSQANTSGSAARLNSGQFGTEDWMGHDWYMSQHVPTHTAGDATDDSVLINSASVAIGDTTVNMDGATTTNDLKAGDIFTVAGDTQNYTVTTTTAAVAGALTAVPFFPAAKVAWADNAALTFPHPKATQATYTANISGARNGLAWVAVPPPPSMGATFSEVVVDEQFGIGMRMTWSFDDAEGADTLLTEFFVGAAVIHEDLLVRNLG